MTPPNDIIATVKTFVLREFLPGENPDELTETTPMITTGILDSIATLKLVAYLEETFGVTIAAHEADAENLNTLASIRGFIAGKLAKAGKGR